MRKAIGVAAFAVFGLAAWAEECPGPSTVTVKGTVHDISTMREEPQALAETWFKIALLHPICGKGEITANVIGSIPCSEGNTIEATGEFSPPSKLTGTVRLHLGQPPVCKAAP